MCLGIELNAMKSVFLMLGMQLAALSLTAPSFAQSLSCLNEKTSCDQSIGILRIQTPLDEWTDLTVGDGKGTGGLILKFLPNALVLGDLRIEKDSIKLVRRFNRSNFSSTINGIPRKFIITYQLYILEGGNVKGVFFDALDYKTMSEIDMRFATWNPALPAYTNNAWTP